MVREREKNNYYRRRNIWRSDHFVSECRKLSGDRKCERKRISMNLLDQAMKLGAETQMAQVTGIRDEGEVKVIVTPEKNIRAGVLF